MNKIQDQNEENESYLNLNFIDLTTNKLGEKNTQNIFFFDDNYLIENDEGPYSPISVHRVDAWLGRNILDKKSLRNILNPPQKLIESTTLDVARRKTLNSPTKITSNVSLQNEKASPRGVTVINTTDKIDSQPVTCEDEKKLKSPNKEYVALQNEEYILIAKSPVASHDVNKYKKNELKRLNNDKFFSVPIKASDSYTDSTDAYHRQPTEIYHHNSKSKEKLVEPLKNNHHHHPTTLQSKHPTSLQTKHPTSLQTKHPTSLHTKHPTSLQLKHPTSLQTKHPTSLQPKHPTSLQSKHPTSLPIKKNYNKLIPITLLPKDPYHDSEAQNVNRKKNLFPVKRTRSKPSPFVGDIELPNKKLVSPKVGRVASSARGKQNNVRSFDVRSQHANPMYCKLSQASSYSSVYDESSSRINSNAQNSSTNLCRDEERTFVASPGLMPSPLYKNQNHSGANIERHFIAEHNRVGGSYEEENVVDSRLMVHENEVPRRTVSRSASQDEFVGSAGQEEFVSRSAVQDEFVGSAGQEESVNRSAAQDEFVGSAGQEESVDSAFHGSVGSTAIEELDMNNSWSVNPGENRDQRLIMSQNNLNELSLPDSEKHLTQSPSSLGAKHLPESTSVSVFNSKLVLQYLEFVDESKDYFGCLERAFTVIMKEVKENPQNLFSYLIKNENQQLLQSCLLLLRCKVESKLQSMSEEQQQTLNMSIRGLEMVLDLVKKKYDFKQFIDINKLALATSSMNHVEIFSFLERFCKYKNCELDKDELNNLCKSVVSCQVETLRDSQIETLRNSGQTPTKTVNLKTFLSQLNTNAVSKEIKDPCQSVNQESNLKVTHKASVSHSENKDITPMGTHLRYDTNSINFDPSYNSTITIPNASAVCSQIDINDTSTYDRSMTIPNTPAIYSSNMVIPTSTYNSNLTNPNASAVYNSMSIPTTYNNAMPIPITSASNSSAIHNAPATFDSTMPIPLTSPTYSRSAIPNSSIYNRRMTIPNTSYSNNMPIPNATVTYNSTMPIPLASSTYSRSMAIPNSSIYNRSMTIPNTSYSNNITIPNATVTSNRTMAVPAISTTYNNTLPMPNNPGIYSRTNAIHIPNVSTTYNNTMNIPNASAIYNNSTMAIPNASATYNNSTMVIPNASAPYNNNVMTIPNASATYNNSIMAIPNASATYNNCTMAIPNASATYNNSSIAIPIASATYNNNTMAIPNAFATYNNSILAVPNGSATYNNNMNIPIYNNNMAIPNAPATYNNSTMLIPNASATYNNNTMTIPNAFATYNNSSMTIPDASANYNNNYNNTMAIPDASNYNNSTMAIPTASVIYNNTQSIPNSLISQYSKGRPTTSRTSYTKVLASSPYVVGDNNDKRKKVKKGNPLPLKKKDLEKLVDNFPNLEKDSQEAIGNYLIWLEKEEPHNADRLRKRLYHKKR